MWAKRADDNQPLIVQAFRDLGCSVRSIHTVGNGVPDLIVGCAGKNLVVEVKDGDKPPSARKLTPAEQSFHDSWKGRVDVVETAQDVVDLVNEVRCATT